MNAARSPFGSQVVARTPEIARIAALPRRAWSEDAATVLAAMLTLELKTPRGTMVLRPVQAVALYEAMQCGGLFGPIRVGAGKTLISLLLPFVLEAKRPVLLLPAALVEKTWRDSRELAEHWRLPTNVQIVSYEMLGLVQSAQKLEYIRPDLIVADECHYLKSHRAGRTRRVIRYMRQHPETQFVGVSGTVMKASIKDFAHLLRFALKNKAPIPATDDEAAAWADALDEKVNPLSRRRPGALLDLGAAGAGDVVHARQVFQARLLETPGVVASPRTDGVTCSLRVSALEYQPSPAIEEHFRILQTKWETPCGKSFSEATEMRMYVRELALGFSYTWVPKEKVDEWERLVRQSKSVESLKTENVGANKISKSVASIAELGITETGRSNLNVPLLDIMEIAEKNISKASTEFLLLNTMRSSPRTVVDATSAGERKQRNPGSLLITATQQIKSEVFSVRNVTEELGCLGTMPLGLNERLRTFLEQNRPPPQWLNARRAWCSFVREQISRSKKYDTMLQIANACDAGLLDSETLDAWRTIEGSYEPAVRPIVYDLSALEVCLRWMQKTFGIVWVEHQAFGEALSLLSGLPYFSAGGLDASGNSIVKEDGKRSIIASVAACGHGFNLQMFSANLVTSCPPGAATVEQLIGRTHRDGQEADEVTVDILLGCREHYDAFQRALDGAKAAADVLGHDQKLLLSDICIPDINNRKGPLWV